MRTISVLSQWGVEAMWLGTGAAWRVDRVVDANSTHIASPEILQGSIDVAL
ncbi:MAG: hypothetical protein ABIT36_01060 [Steroidobacteraceae bacterium]